MHWFSDLVRGIAVLRVVGAEPTRFLEECANSEIEFWGAVPEDEFTITLSMRTRNIGRAPELAKKSCCDVQLIETKGGPKYTKRLRRRFALWVLPVMLASVLVFSSFFVWRIEITGNETITDIEILNALEISGVHIGSFWPSFTSDSIRSRVLVEIPELKWLSVSVFGSRAYVDVRERTDVPVIFNEDEYYKIIASRGGIITETNVLRGVGQFSVGETAAAGDMLIDGVVMSPFAGVQFVHAKGSVTARTWYELTAVMPMTYAEKEYTGKTRNKFSLIIGDNRINFYRNSGILELMCDNIITESKLGIDGLFTLPVSLVRERSEAYELSPASYTERQAKQLLESALNASLLQKVGEGGQVVSAEFTVGVVDGYAVGTLRAECVQNIAVEQPLTAEEISQAKNLENAEKKGTEE